jgi:hypothetical protein
MPISVLSVDVIMATSLLIMHALNAQINVEHVMIQALVLNAHFQELFFNLTNVYVLKVFLIILSTVNHATKLA